MTQVRESYVVISDSVASRCIEYGGGKAIMGTHVPFGRA